MIIAFDPGKTTGIAMLDSDYHIRTMITDSLTEIWLLLHEHNPSIIIYESFVLYAHKASAQIGNDFPSAQVIGVLKLYAELNNVVLYAQPAASAKQLISDQALQRLGSYPISTHARDAKRHLCYWLITSATDNPIKKSFRESNIREKVK